MKVFLVLVIWFGTMGPAKEVSRHEFETLQQCKDALSVAVVEVAQHGDAEGGMALYCAVEKQ